MSTSFCFLLSSVFISKVPRDLWFLNLVDSSCRHSFHKYLLRSHCVLSTLPATWDPSEKIILRPLPLCSPHAGPRLAGPPWSAPPLAAWGEGEMEDSDCSFSVFSPRLPRPWAVALFSLGLMTPTTHTSPWVAITAPSTFHFPCMLCTCFLNKSRALLLTTPHLH